MAELITIAFDTRNFAELLQHVYSAVEQVNNHISCSDFMASRYSSLARKTEKFSASDPLGLNSYLFGDCEGEEHLQELNLIRYWEEYFEYVLNQCNVQKQKYRSENNLSIMSKAYLGFLLDRLKVPADQLDRYGERLVAEYRRLRVVPEARVQGVLRRRVVLNSFIKNLEIGLAEQSHAGQLDNGASIGLRQRKPPASAIEEETVKGQITESGQRGNSTVRSNQVLVQKVRRVLASDSTLIAATMIATLVAAIIKGYSYSLAQAQEAPQLSPRENPEFFTTLADMLLQLLGLFTLVRPILCHRVVRSSYARWAMALAVASLAAPLAGLMVFLMVGPPTGQLVVFAGAVMQSIVVLELVWAVDRALERQDMAESDGKGDKDL